MSTLQSHRRVTEALVSHVITSRFEALPAAVTAATKTFILDSLGVGLSGTRVPTMQSMHRLAASWGSGTQARVWGTGERVTASAAAFLNSYQIHNQEWDCLHEPAVVHPMTVVLATLLAYAEAARPERRLSGRDLQLGCSVAVDVATAIGASVTNSLRFFRPAMCGALGATAGIAAMRRYDADRTLSALGHCYSQLSGTMQAHVEGSLLLPMQIGFNARAALNAIWLAEHDIQGLRDFLEGAFGYFALIDPEWQPEVLLSRLNQPQITRLSHKPFPSGRATHGGVDGVLSLRQQHRFDATSVREVRVYAPPLVIQLVDRVPSPTMAASYARLCLPYVVATALLTGGVTVADFDPSNIERPDIQALAKRVRVIADGNPSLSALAPQRVEVVGSDGTTFAIDLPAVLGSPDRPLSLEQHLAKFRRAASSGLPPFPRAQQDSLISLVDTLDSLADVSTLVDHLIVAG